MNNHLDEVQREGDWGGLEGIEVDRNKIIYGKNLNDSSDEMVNESFNGKVNEMKADLVVETDLLNQHDSRSMLLIQQAHEKWETLYPLALYSTAQKG